VELGRHDWFRPSCREACRFDSCVGYKSITWRQMADPGALDARVCGFESRRDSKILIDFRSNASRLSVTK